MISAPRPLVVDLDDSLVKTDTLVEQLIWLAFKSPRHLFALLLMALKNRAAFKEAVGQRVRLDAALLPYDAEVLDLIRAKKAAGGEVHLVTAADHQTAESVSVHLGCFDSARGSDGATNFKGLRKAELLTQLFPEGFAYAGDSAADLHVWGRAQEIIVVRPRGGVLSALRRKGLTADLVFERRKPSLRRWLKMLRVHQWSKNALVFVPLLLAHAFDLSSIARTVAATLAFSVIASATYIINDLSDLEADRRHPTKRRRPIPAGDISIGAAAFVAAALLVGGFAGAAILGVKFLISALVYVGLTLTYTFKLKREPLIDVLTIGCLFALRIVAGMVVLNQPISLWLSTFTLTLFTSLALAKRNAELVQADEAGAIPGRGYLGTDRYLTTSLGISLGSTAVLMMILYMALESLKTGLYHHVKPLFLIPLVLSAWILRIWFRAYRGALSDDPVIFAIRDKVSWGMGMVIAVLWALSIAPH
jgi:4-hydroxybenzoate polyprenyltransferase